jgi:uncharacterized membrane protein
MGTSMDLLAIVLLTFLIDLLIYGVPVEPARVVLGLLFVLFFPGYVLVAVLYPRQWPGLNAAALPLKNDLIYPGTPLSHGSVSRDALLTWQWASP